MLKILTIITVFVSFLYSATITDYKIFKKDDSVDIMLILDKRFNGEVIKEFESDNFLKYKITDINYTHKLTKDIKYKNINSVTITPIDDGVLFSIATNSKFKVEFAKLAQTGNGLMFNIKANTLLEDKKLKVMTKEEQKDIDYNRYFMVVGIMALLLIVLIVVKRKVEGGLNFGIKIKKNKSPNIEIIYQKNIDIKTKIQLIQIENFQYLILSSPSNNLLLDKYEVTDDIQKIEENREKFNNILSSTEENFNKIVKGNK